MYRLTVDTTKGPIKCPVYDPLEDTDVIEKYKNRYCVGSPRGRYLNIACAFDIETTNIINVDRPYAFMYQWQFCIDHDVFFGRTWDSFQDFIGILSDRLQLNASRRLVVYVHNLSFEFQFMRRFFSWTNVFLKGPRNVLRAVANDVIEFRDSYALSNMSLAKFCENTPGIIFTKNDSEQFNYHKIRTPETKLTRLEQSYCYCDVAGLCECIKWLMKEDNLAKIPMTSTGYVRRDFRHEYSKDKRLRAIWKSTRLTPETYRINRAAFRGGDTHASFNYVGQVLHNVHSYDISSSYPAAMLLDQYPVTAFAEISPAKWLERNKMPHYASLLYVRFENLEYIGDAGMPYISIDKCAKISSCRINDNGRVLRCGPYQDGEPGVCEMWITDIDMKIIEHDYTWSHRWIGRVFVSKYGPLPDAHKKQVMHYFKLKTELKNVPGREYEYGKAKNRLNAGYGMMVTDVAKADWEYEAGEYQRKPYDIAEKLDKFYQSKQNFLRYEQGVWVTANARYRLRQMIWKVGKDVVYVDTDSIKCRGDHAAEFEAASNEIISRCKELGYYAVDPGGVAHYPGAWENDGEYTLFKTLGSKRYLVQPAGSDSFKTTIAGVDRKRGAEYFTKHGIDAFTNGCRIDNAGHTVAYYNDDQLHWIECQGVKIRTGANVAIKNEAYTLGITAEYWDIIKKVLDNIADVEYN